MINYRLIKLIFGGLLAALSNILIIFLLVDKLDFNTPLLRNIANFISVEISLIISFFIYRYWVWSKINDEVGKQLLQRILIYHLSTLFPTILRILIVFPLLDILSIHYLYNTIIGILISFLYNFMLSDDFIYLYKQNQRSKAYLPDNLESGILNTRDLNINNSRINTISEIDRNEFKLSIVIPAHNEETIIESTLSSLLKTLKDSKINFEILVINDNSTDGTEEVLRNLSNKEVRYINNHYPNGYGYAVRCGLESFDGQAVAIVMADNSDSPDDIVKYYNELVKGYDCVFGSRFLYESEIYDYPIHKLFLNRMGNLFIQLIFGIKYNDTTNAFKAYRREVIKGISPLISHHFNLTVEMPLKAISRGFSYSVVPISWRNRSSGISKLKIKEMGSRYLFIVLSIFLEKALSRGDYKRNIKVV